MVNIFSKPEPKKPISELGFIAVPDNIKESFIKEAMKGDVKNNTDKFAELPISIPRIDDELTEKTYVDINFVQSVVDKIVDFVWGPGVRIESKDERIQTVINQWLDDVDFDQDGRKWTREGLVKRGGFLELGGTIDEVPQGIKVLDAKRMFIERDNKGKIKRYWQLKSDAKKMNTYTKENFNKFEPHEISYFNLNSIGDNPYGYGIIHANLPDIDNMLSLEGDMAKLMKRKANVPIVATMGDRTQDLMPSSEDLTSFGNNLQYMNNKTEWAVSDLVRLSVLDFGKLGEKFDYPLSHTMEKLSLGFQTPQVLLGLGNIPEGLADVQTQFFKDGRIKSIRKTLEKPLEKIFERILRANKLQGEFNIIWGEPGTLEKEKRIAQITQILTNPMIPMKLRMALEQELASLFDIPPDLVEDDEEERRKEEEENKEPRVPGQNDDTKNESLKKKVKCICNHCAEKPDGSMHEYDVKKDHTLKEWLGFNYEDYLEDVIKVTNADKFELLRAVSEDDIQAGLFTQSQVDTLRSVIKDGFETGKTIQEIARDIRENIDIKDRYRTKDHKLELNSDGNPILSVRAGVRPVMIARSETVRLANEGSRENYKKSNIKEYSWVASMSDRTCPICENLNGQIIDINSRTIPPAHAMCRCTIVPVVDLE